MKVLSNTFSTNNLEIGTFNSTNFSSTFDRRKFICVICIKIIPFMKLPKCTFNFFLFQLSTVKNCANNLSDGHSLVLQNNFVLIQWIFVTEETFFQLICTPHHREDEINWKHRTKSKNCQQYLSQDNTSFPSLHLK